MLKLNNIKTVFNKGTVDETTLFDGFNLNVDKGEFVSVIGSNGSGKTTMLNLICGSLFPDGGSVEFDGRNITKMPEYKRARFLGRSHAHRPDRAVQRRSRSAWGAQRAAGASRRPGTL